LAPKPTILGEMVQNNSYYVVKGHHFWSQSIQKPICDFLLVNNTTVLSHTVYKISLNIRHIWRCWPGDDCL